MKKRIIALLCIVSMLVLVGCSSKPKFDTGDKELDKDLEEIYDELNEDIEDEEEYDEEEYDPIDSEIVVKDVYISSESETISLFIVNEDYKYNGFSLKGNYRFNLIADYYGEKTELYGTYKKMDFLTNTGISIIEYEIPSKIELYESTLTLNIYIKNDGEEVSSEEIDLPKAGNKEPSLVYDEFIVDAINSGLIENYTNKIECEIQDVYFERLVDNMYGDYSLKIVAKIKNNDTVLKRFYSPSVHYPGYLYTEKDFKVDIEAVKPGEEQIITYSSIPIYTEVIRSKWSKGPTEKSTVFFNIGSNENKLIIMDDGKFYKAVKAVFEDISSQE